MDCFPCDVFWLGEVASIFGLILLGLCVCSFDTNTLIAISKPIGSVLMAVPTLLVQFLVCHNIVDGYVDAACCSDDFLHMIAPGFSVPGRRPL